MKKLVKVVTMIMILATVGGVLTLFNACKKEPEKPVYEIKLYDDNWVELEKKELASSYKSHKFEYDGEIKCFNAIAYRNGVEFYRFDYTDPTFYSDRIINLSINNSTVDIEHLPQKKGEYNMRYSYTWRSAYGLPQVFEGEDFPHNVAEYLTIVIL